MSLKKPRGQIAAEVTRRAREKNRHGLSALSGAGRGTCGNRLRPPVQLARRAGFERSAFPQRIAPATKRRGMHVNPVVPPIDRFGIECKEFFFFRTQGGGEQSGILAFEKMIVVKGERLL